MTKEPKLELENSQTLFRFTTIRAPQKISEESKTDYFIHHPNVENSPLYATSNEQFQEKLNAFNPISAKDLKSENIELYKFSENVLQSRSFIQTEEFLNRVTELSNISSEKYNKIWDAFCYQVFKGNDTAEREILSTFIYGYNCLEKGIIVAQEAIESSNIDEFRRFLTSKIVIPVEFISPENNPIIVQSTSGGNQTNSSSTMNYAAKMQKEQVLTADFQLSQCKMLMTTLENAQKNYLELEAFQRKEFDKNAEAAYNEAYQRYLKEHPSAINPTPPSEHPEVIPPFIPPVLTDTFDYKQLETDILEKELANENKAIFDKFGLNALRPILENREKLSEVMRNAYQQKFENIPAERQTIVIDGQSIERPSFGIDKNTVSLCAETTGSTTSFNGGYFSFSNPNEYATSVRYRVGGTGSFITGEVFQNGFSFTSPYSGLTAPNYGTSYNVEVEVTTNYGTYSASLTIMEQTCFFGDLTPTFVGESPSENPIYGITRLGIMDYRKVEQYICCYVPGEVSHIENIMAREYKSRTTRRLRRSENTTTINTESEREKLTDTASTEKNEMQEELSKLMQETKDFQINAGISWNGLVSGHVDGSFAYNTSKEESNNLAKSMSKELTMKATERILDKTREERIQKIVEEYSDESQHGVDNRQGDKHISGVYRWVDKIYKNVIHNYGKRLLYEFMIPEPASFHQISLENKPNLVAKVSAPVHPKDYGLYSPSELNQDNFTNYAGIYGVDIDSPPAEGINISKSYNGGMDKGGASKYSFSDILVPEGYRLLSVNCKYDHKRYSTNNYRASDSHLNVMVSIGNQYKRIYGAGDWAYGNDANETSFSFNYWNDDALTAESVPVGVSTWDVGAFTLIVNAIFKRLTPIYKDWQVASYNKIMKAYDEKYKVYQEKLAEAQAQQVEARQTNSLFYREIEQMVLRKNCMAYLTNDGFLNQGFVSGNELKSHAVTQNKNLEDYAAKVKFLEQAFEWEIMGYQFYPFYWADKNNWDALYSRETSDKLFTKFLQSGMARVFLTVRPGFEEAVNWYIATGQVWMGSQPPVIGDELFLSLVDELKQPDSVVEEEWESRVPSTLTVIQADSIALDTSGLPCMDTCKEHKSMGFESDTTTLKSLNVKLD